MKKIKVMFKATDKRLEMQVVDIHESFDELRGSGIIVHTAKFNLQSAHFPELAYDSIYLPGTSRLNDYHPVSRTFENNKERDTYIKKANIAFIAWEGDEKNEKN